jgi:hypothetical protein
MGCSAWLDSNKLLGDLNGFVGQSSLSLTGFDTDKYRNYHSWSIETPTAEQEAECFGGSSQLFVQIGCTLGHDEVHQRQVQGLLIACLTVAVALYVSVFTDYVRQVAKNNFVEWDVKTVTAGDYSIEFDITDEFYDSYVRMIGINQDKNIAMASHFREWIQNEMEAKLKQIPDLGYEEVPQERIEIAATSFAFENAPLIHLLRQRGAAIKADKFDDMRKIDAQINDYKNANLDKCTRPCSVFMTFESEEGYQRARQFDEIVKNSSEQRLHNLDKWLDGHTIEIQEASEPSDIIWENRHIEPWTRTKREAVVALVIGLALLVSFGLVFAGRKAQADVYAKYPVPASCAPFYDNYGESLEGFAVTDYEANTAREAAG